MKKITWKLIKNCMVLLLIFNYSELRNTEAATRGVLWKKVILRNFTKLTGKHLCNSLLFNKVAGPRLIKKETLVQVFSCKFCEISNNTFFTEHLWATPSVGNSVVITHFLKHFQTQSKDLFKATVKASARRSSTYIVRMSLLLNLNLYLISK